MEMETVQEKSINLVFLISKYFYLHIVIQFSRRLTKKKGDKRSISDVEEGEVSDSESEIGEFDDGLDDELMGYDEDR